MKELRTPESIMESEGILFDVFDDYEKESMISAIRTAQREALEAAAENAKVKVVKKDRKNILGGHAFKIVYEVDKDNILNLMPKP